MCDKSPFMSDAIPQLDKFFSKNIILSISIFLSICQISIAQGPPGYTYCADEGDSFTLPAKCHIAYGAANRFKYLFNQTGTVTFNTETFGGDPIFGTYKSGYYKLATGAETPAILQKAMLDIKKHILGTTILTPTTINTVANTIQLNIFVIADNNAVVLDAFDVVDTYEKILGPIFLNTKTKGGFPNDFGATDGFELVRAVFLIQQGIMDYVYTPQNSQKYKSLLVGRKFLTSNHFPGICPAPTDSLKTYTAKINGTMVKEYGKRTAFSSTPARRPTGYYLSPGSIGKVKVPTSLIGKGFKILVGAHTFERTGSNPCRRFFRITNTFPINDTITEIVNPFGGGIYIITPYLASEGIVDIELSNVIPAPFFSAKSFDKTTLQNWQDVQRKHAAPWADFETDKYMMQVPTSWIFNYADPVTLMADWDNRMDVVSKLLGYPPVNSNTMLYLQIDVDIMFNGYGIGNPQINNTYNPSDVENGNKNHWLLKPGDGFWETEFHEMGHAQLFSKFPGEVEAIVNVPAAAIYNRLYGMDIDRALGESFNNSPQITRDQAALNWMVTPNFRAGKPMDISNTTKDEVRYQQRGYAKYIEMAALFGWEMIDSFYKKEQLDFIAQAPPDGLNDVDSRIFRFSKTAGVDLRPLIHFWGLQPQNNTALKAKLVAENLGQSKLICDRLTYYKSIIPLNNAQFRTHANQFFGGSVPAGGDPNYGSGWYNLWLPMYNNSHGTQAQNAMQTIINTYFPNGCPTEAAVPVVTVNSDTICFGQSITLTASGAMYYQWSNGATDRSITVTPSQSISYTVTGKMAGYTSLPATAQVFVAPIPIVTADNTTVCTGQTATLTASGANSYLWSTGETTASIVVNANVSDTLYVSGISLGCPSTEVAATIIAIPLPVVSVNSADICAGEMATLTASGATDYQWSNGLTGSSITISPAETEKISLTGTSTGCVSDTVETFVNVRPLPLLEINGDSVCLGQVATLTASGATDYLWSNGGTTSSIEVFVQQSTAFTVTGTTDGCIGAATSNVTVFPLPGVDLGSDIMLSQGQDTILTASQSGLSYLWSTGATTQSIVVNAMGVYSVTVADEHNCFASDTIWVSFISSNSDLQVANISISPNPTHDLVTIKSDIPIVSYQVLNVLGKVMIEGNLPSNESIPVLDISELPPGSYFVKVVGNKLMKTMRVVKI